MKLAKLLPDKAKALALAVVEDSIGTSIANPWPFPYPPFYAEVAFFIDAAPLKKWRDAIKAGDDLRIEDPDTLLNEVNARVKELVNLAGDDIIEHGGAMYYLNSTAIPDEPLMTALGNLLTPWLNTPTWLHNCAIEHAQALARYAELDLPVNQREWDDFCDRLSDATGIRANLEDIISRDEVYAEDSYDILLADINRRVAKVNPEGWPNISVKHHPKLTKLLGSLDTEDAKGVKLLIYAIGNEVIRTIEVQPDRVPEYLTKGVLAQMELIDQKEER